MCKRKNDPHKGKINLIGGKIEYGENGLSAAYREMFEETNIQNTDIQLNHLMDITYYHLEIYVGILENNVNVYGEENELIWINANSNFFDENIFAGNGLIGHILSAFEIWKNNIKGIH